MKKKKEVPERLQLLIKQVVTHFENEDSAVRERQLRIWKKLKYYWNGFYQTWWSETAHDWRVFDQNIAAQSGTDSSYYDKPVNVFKAYLESIIAALSITIPAVKCYPDDADNELDLATAKAGDKVAELISKHNDVTLLWLHALFIYCTEGLVCCYNYTKEDFEYGSYEVPDYKESSSQVDVPHCPTCGKEIPVAEINNLLDEYDPDKEDVELHDLLKSGTFCPECMTEVEPLIQEKTIVIKRLIGQTSAPKSRQCMEIYGGLFVKIANYARKQSETPYLIYSYEQHYAMAIEEYPDLVDNVTKETKITSGGGNDTYGKWARISTQYFGDAPNNNVTIRKIWLRPCAFNVLTDVDDIKELKKLYPDGCKVDMVNDLFACAENESLDDHWSITHNPLSDYLHHDPLGLLLTSIQDITNELVSLVLQTVEHGIPQTFADPSVLNFTAYRENEVRPGDIFPAKSASGKGLGDGFFTIKTATLSQEVLPFAEKVQEMGQLVTGALPSLFGGAQSQGRTAAQYSMSRAQALQRLQTPWKMFTVWWKQIYGKVIPAYIKEVKEDERVVKKDDLGNFVNVLIRQSELEGKIGSVELEASEQMPQTWAQKKDVVMQLLQGGNPEVMTALSAPENIEMLRDAIGLTDFVMPGEDDRDKQLEEIRLLLQSGPIDPNTPSIQVNPDLDNNAIEGEIIRSWLVGPSGRLAKTENPNGYENCLLHFKQHKQAGQPPPQPMSGNAAPIAQKLPKGQGNVAT